MKWQAWASDSKVVTGAFDGADVGYDWLKVEEKMQIVSSPSSNKAVIQTSSLDTATQYVKKGDNLWGLKAPTWNLPKVTSDYYMLSLASFMDEKKYTPYLQNRTDMLADQFTRYTDMAVGGELRHTKVKIEGGQINADEVPRQVLQALNNTTLQGSRNSAWEGWYHFRQRFGTLALVWAVETFSISGWGGGYGGTKWANIANTLLMYEKGDITKHTFVDTCFGLQHNGGVYFDKWWTTTGIKKVLDSNQQGLYCSLHPRCSLQVFKLIPKHIIEETCQCGNHLKI